MTRRPIAVLVLVLSGPAAFAQKAEDIVHWKASTAATPVKPGGTLPIRLTAEIADGWHMYALTQAEGGPSPLEIALANGQPFTLDPRRVEGPLPAVAEGAGGEPDVFQYDGSVALSVPLGAPKTVKPGKHTVTIQPTYQVCSGSICLRPATASVPVTVTVAR